MKLISLAPVFFVLSLGLATLGHTETQAELETEQQKMDGALHAKPDAGKVDSLSKQFKVETTAVSDLRAKNRGWGEIGIELSMAQKLMESDPTTYPTMADAVTKLETMRSDGSGWGKIANDLGMKLGPIVSESRQARNAIRREARAERRLEHRERRKGERAPRAERPEKPGKPEKTH